MAVVCGSSLGLVSVCSLSTSANNDSVRPYVAPCSSEEKVSLGSKIFSIVKVCTVLQILISVGYLLYIGILMLWRKIVDFNLRTKDGKKTNLLNIVVSEGKENDGCNKGDDFTEYDLGEVSIEEENLNKMFAENEYTDENMSPYGWEKGKYTEKEEKKKIQEIHDWVDGKDCIFKENEIDDDFEKNFEYRRRRFSPEKGCYLSDDNKDLRECYRYFCIVKEDEVCV